MGSCRMHAKFRTIQITPHSSMNQDIRWDLAGFTRNFKKLAHTESYKPILSFKKCRVHPAGSHLMSSIILEFPVTCTSNFYANVATGRIPIP
jgi:hypothetical protein